MRNIFLRVKNSETSRKLIFDVGAHTGEDTDFYLKKGFDVIAIEANPDLTKKMSFRFKDEVAKGQLRIESKAITEELLKSVTLYVNTAKDDWSSLFQDVAKKGSYEVIEHQVETVTLEELFKMYGCPYYMKVDLELYDVIIARELLNSQAKPPFVSFEIHDLEILDVLRESGYKSFQIRNQLFNSFIERPQPVNEGLDYFPEKMDGYNSGTFGKDLPQMDWRTYEETLKILQAYEVLTTLDFLKLSWLDIHARLD
jgi:FkbM family methyltransferase